MLVFEVDLKEWLGTEQGKETEAWFTNAIVWSICGVMAMTREWGSGLTTEPTNVSREFNSLWLPLTCDCRRPSKLWKMLHTGAKP